jgi:hypothetical protein
MDLKEFLHRAGNFGRPQSADGFEEVCNILSNASLHRCKRLMTHEDVDSIK